jgi:hypothetical protein
VIYRVVTLSHLKCPVFNKYGPYEESMANREEEKQSTEASPEEVQMLYH